MHVCFDSYFLKWRYLCHFAVPVPHTLAAGQHLKHQWAQYGFSWDCLKHWWKYHGGKNPQNQGKGFNKAKGLNARSGLLLLSTHSKNCRSPCDSTYSVSTSSPTVCRPCKGCPWTHNRTAITSGGSQAALAWVTLSPVWVRLSLAVGTGCSRGHPAAVCPGAQQFCLPKMWKNKLLLLF